MARMSPRDRRQAIVDAALAVALRKGLAATTVRDVAGEMGTSSGLIHHYFDSMDEVLAEAFAQAAGQDLAATVEAMAPYQDPVERLAAFFRSYVRSDQDWAFQLWLDAWAEAGRRPALRRSSVRLNVAWQQLLAATIEAGVENGVMSCDDPDAASWRIVSLLDGLSLQVVAHRANLDRATVTAWVVASTENELGLPEGRLAELVHSPTKLISARPRRAR
ncbi:MAG TPA: TetR family transcriptional regulator C-terminal domain-containing protein [Acidimicrobiia bacterium]|nr:TetR family transcriptional regulator C-terminal domain-containing protein [Acidimicrobiia bacterium]